MPLSAAVQPKLLDQLLGCVEAQCNSTIAAGTTAQTTFNLRGSIGSGNADVTPSSGEVWLFMTPGSGATQNQYTNPETYVATGGTATSITFASRTVVPGRAVGDIGFRLLATSSFLRYLLENTIYVGLSTAGATTSVAAGSDLAALPQATINVVSTGAGNGGAALAQGGNFPSGGGVALIDSSNGLQTVTFTGVTATTLTGCTGGSGTIDTTSTVIYAPTSAVILAAEPSSTGGYARVAVVNNPANWSAATGSMPASKSNTTQINFAQSTAAWSSGATQLNIAFLADASTLAGGGVLAWTNLNPAQTVNAALITPNLPAATGFPLTLL
jgi:hypothetical protein